MAGGARREEACRARATRAHLSERLFEGITCSLIGCVVSLLPPPAHALEVPRAPPSPHLLAERGEVPDDAGDMAPAGRTVPRFCEPSMMTCVSAPPCAPSARSIEPRCIGVATALGRLSSGEGTIPLFENKPDM